MREQKKLYENSTNDWWLDETAESQQNSESAKL